MKIGLALGAFSIGARPLDFAHLYDSPRGLTGTDLNYVRTGEELEKLGHEVVRFTGTGSLVGLVDDSFDAVVSINEPNILIGLPKKPLKIVWQMLNDFSFIAPGFDDHVDHYFGVCDEHTNYVAKQCPHPEKWSTLSLGCDPELYNQKEKVPGRVVWCSSADRGLHWLLSVWSEVKEAVPHASLRVFYHFSYDHVIGVEPTSVSPQGGPYHHHIQEMAQRVRYIKDALPKLAHLDVTHVGSVSRDQMVKEWNQASVFGFSADTVAFSEGFSVSTLEAHASYTLPIISDVDCLGGIYKDSGCIMIPSPIKNNLSQLKNELIYQLKDIDVEKIKKCRQFAEKHTWKESARQLEQYIKENLKK